VRAIAEGVFAAATRKYPLSIGKAVSKRERDERSPAEAALLGPSYNYSEASFEAVHHAVHRVRSVLGKPGRGSSPPEGVLQGEVLTELGSVAGGGSFYDLGAGTGKALVAAAATHSFSYLCGVEALEGLHNASLELLAGYEARHRRKLEGISPAMLEFAVREQEIDVRQGDFTEDDCADWVTGDVVFANCTCYDDELMGKIAEMAGGMRQGTFFVSVTRALESDAFELVDSAVLPVSWGDATLFIQQVKKVEDELEETEEREEEEEEEEEEEKEGGGEEKGAEEEDEADEVDNDNDNDNDDDNDNDNDNDKEDDAAAGAEDDPGEAA
jgi:SAM-dependent methyltransferase